MSRAVIKVKKGRAYLHTEGIFDEERSIKWVCIKPLGSSPRFIKSISQAFKAKVKFI